MKRLALLIVFQLVFAATSAWSAELVKSDHGYTVYDDGQVVSYLVETTRTGNLKLYRPDGTYLGHIVKSDGTWIDLKTEVEQYPRLIPDTLYRYLVSYYSLRDGGIVP